MSGTTLDLSADQKRAHDTVVDWLRSRSGKLMTLGGYAGTGKSTTLGAIARTLKKRDEHLAIAFACFTGKAAHGLRLKLEAARVLDEDGGDYCGTLHGLLYEAVRLPSGGVRWRRRPRSEMAYGLFVLDEASMVDEPLLKDLSSYGIPILAVGDHGQLPPINGALNLMKNPDLRLEKIHRQAEDSPIIRLSMMARLDGKIPVGAYGPGVYKTTDASILDRLRDPKAGVVLCATNRTRGRINRLLRKRCGHLEAEPQVGEPIIALKNDRDAGTYNGMVGILASWKKAERATHAEAIINFPDAGVTWAGDALRAQFGAGKTLQATEDMPWQELGGLFDWAYGITTHKAQGAEFENVVVIEETDHMKTDEEKRRWLYTAVTRAKQKLVIIGAPC
ncbi:MAG: AAA family ATPase [Sphingomonadales bacterium]|nr:AAA family ATPase [Sphingomonadaceae bacterium]MBS3930464.1 AAA family ATPase [Sphingomonadales bacterium]